MESSSIAESRTKAMINLRFVQGKYEEVFKLLTENTFSDKTGLLDLWDDAHYKAYENKWGRKLTALMRFRIRKRYPPPPNVCPNGVRPSARLGEPACRLLKSWFLEHQHHPYPSKDEKEKLSTVTGLSLEQIKTWFANARRRTKLKTTSSSIIRKNEKCKEKANVGKIKIKKENETNTQWANYTDISDDGRETAPLETTLVEPRIEPAPLDMRCPSKITEVERKTALANMRKNLQNSQQYQESFSPQQTHYYSSHYLSSLVNFVNNSNNSSSSSSSSNTLTATNFSTGNHHLPYSPSSSNPSHFLRSSYNWHNHSDHKIWLPRQQHPVSSSYSADSWPVTAVDMQRSESTPPVTSPSSITCPTSDSGRLPPLSPQIFGWTPGSRAVSTPPPSQFIYYNNQPLVSSRPLSTSSPRQVPNYSTFNLRPCLPVNQIWLQNLSQFPHHYPLSYGMVTPVRQPCLDAAVVDVAPVTSAGFSGYSSSYVMMSNRGACNGKSVVSASPLNGYQGDNSRCFESGWSVVADHQHDNAFVPSTVSNSVEESVEKMSFVQCSENTTALNTEIRIEQHEAAQLLLNLHSNKQPVSMATDPSYNK